MKRLAVAALFACASREKTAEEEFTTWSVKEETQAWQGAFVMRLDPDKPVVAVKVEGDKATVFDGKTETQETFAVLAPCLVAIGKHELQFVVRDGELLVGRGAAGKVKGKTAIVCGDGRDPGAPEEGVYVVKDVACKTYKRDAQGTWKGRRGVCAWANARGDNLIDVGTEHYYSSLVINGDVAEERAFTKSAKENGRAASWDAAKAKIVAPAEQVDHLKEALAAGGKIGDLTTIAGLHATFAHDKRQLVSVELELTGTVREATTNTTHGKITTTFVTIADDSKLALVCAATGEVNVKAGDTVVVRGRADMGHDSARLRPCTVARDERAPDQ